MSDYNEYRRLSTDRHDKEALLEDDDQGRDGSTELSTTPSLCNTQRNRSGWTTRFNVICAVINSCLLLMLLYLIVSSRTSQSSPPWQYKTNKNQLLKQTSYYSPYLDRVEIPFIATKVDGFLVDQTSPPNILKQPPSPEVDAAWKRLYRFKYQLLTRAEVMQLGKDPALSVKAPASWGHGDEAYISRSDVAHRIHCLDMLRRASYPESVYAHLRAGGEEATRALWRPHVAHCTHVLLQHLMCTATAEAVTYNWFADVRYPVADFSINRKCLDLEAVLAWQEEQEEVLDFGDADKIREWLDNVPEDTPRLPVPQAYLDLFNDTTMMGEAERLMMGLM